MERSNMFNLFLLAVCLLILPNDAFAYVDPGSGYLVLQVIASVFIGILLSFKQVGAWLKTRFTKLGKKDK